MMMMRIWMMGLMRSQERTGMLGAIFLGGLMHLGEQDQVVVMGKARVE
jgi:hypothetical protein